jgi:hypothetical protein
MPDGSTLLLFIGAGAVLVSLPGPAVIYVVMQSLDQGRQAGMVSVLGIGTSTFGYTLVASAALAGPTAVSATGIAVIRYLGAAYLVYLGIRKLLERQDTDVPVSSTHSRHYFGGMIIQALNPKIAIFFTGPSAPVRPSIGRPDGWSDTHLRNDLHDACDALQRRLCPARRSVRRLAPAQPERQKHAHEAERLRLHWSRPQRPTGRHGQSSVECD